MTLILNTLLLLLLAILAWLLIRWRKRPDQRNLKRWFVFLGLIFLLTAIFRFLVSKEEHAATDPQTLSSVRSSEYSPAFTQSVEKIFSSYFRLSDQLAAGNGEGSEEEGMILKQALDSFDIEELVSDTKKYDAVYLSLDNARAETTAIIIDPDLAERRASMNILSRELYSLLLLLRMGQLPYFRLICADAFGKGHEGWWIGKTADASNPYGLTGCSNAQRITKEEEPIIK